MVRTAPDYSNVRVDKPLHRLDDMAELAARLGSPSIYDRAGSVVWITSFEHGLQGIVPGIDAAPSKVTVTAKRSIHGSFSIELDPSSTKGSYAEWRGQATYLPAGNMGFEVSISPDTDQLSIRFIILVYDGTNRMDAILFYYPDTGDWEVFTKGETYEPVLSGFKLQQGPGAWHPVKLVIDTENERYVRLLVGKHAVDLSTYELFKTGDDSLAQSGFGVTAFGSSAKHAPVYIDSVILTQNEP